MPKQNLAISIRNLAATVRQVNVNTGTENDVLRDASAMLRTLSALLDGKPLAQAFGAPGDWGYETEIGKSVKQLHAAPAERLSGPELLESLTALLNDPTVIEAAQPGDIGRALCAVRGI